MSGWVHQTRKGLSRLFLICLTRSLKLFSLLVPYRLGVWAGGTLGLIAYFLLPRERKRALLHLTSVFEEKEGRWIRLTARNSFVHLGKALLEVMLMTPRRLSQVVAFHGESEKKLRSAMKPGKGAVFVTGHIGNWELMGNAVATRYPLSVVAAPIEPEQVNDMLVRLRAGMGVRTILRGRPGGSRELVRIFKEHRILGILIDQDTDVDGAFVDFMGKPAWTPTAAVAMAIKFGAPMLFGYIRRGADDRHTISIEGPLELLDTGDREKDIVANTAMLTKKIEDAIRNSPEQWVWMHRRWRRQP